MQSEAAVEAISGCIGSILALLATYPLKSVYTLQATATNANSQNLGILGILLKYKLQGLYAGIGPNMFETAVSSSVYFGLYARLKSLVIKARTDQSGVTDKRSLRVVESLLVAACSGAINQILTLPASVVATRMLTSQREGQHPSLLSVIKAIYHENGLKGFWSGIVPALVLVVNPAIQYLIYEQLLKTMRGWKEAREKARLNSKEPEKAESDNRPKDLQLSAGEIFIASSLAKMGATIATYPLIVVKAKMQSDSSGYNALKVIGDVLRADGLFGFFRGLRAKILQAMLNSALLMTLKEQLHSGVRASLSKGLDFKDTRPT